MIIHNNIIVTWIDDINYQPNLNLNISSINLNVYKIYNYPMVKFSTNTSFIKTLETINNIGGFIAVVKVSNNDINYLYSPIDENSELSFKYIGYILGEYNNDDLQFQSNGSVYYNGTCVYNKTDQSEVKQFIGETVNNLVIVYVNFKNLNIENLSITLGSTFMNKGFRGLIGDFIVFNKNHTKEDQIYMEGYLAKKWNMINKLNVNHLFYNPIIASQEVASQEIAALLASQEAAALLASQEAATLAAQIASQEAATLAAQIASQEAATLAAQIASQEAATLAAQIAAQEAATLAAQIASQEAATLAAQIASEEAARIASEEAVRIAASQEAARIVASQEAARIASEEAVRIAASQEAARIVASQEAARIASEEAVRIAASQEAARIASEEAVRIAASQEAARIVASQEAARIASEEAVSQEAAPFTNNNAVAYYNANNSIRNTNGIIQTLFCPLFSNYNLSTSSNNLTIEQFQGKNMIKFPTNASYIQRSSTYNDIGGFIAVVKLSDNDLDRFKFLYSQKDTSNNEYTYNIGFEYISENPLFLSDLQFHGSLYYNSICVYDGSNTNNIEQFNYNFNNPVIIYVNFKSMTSPLSSITLGYKSTGKGAVNRGFKGLIGDFILLNKNHTDINRINLENFLSEKWNIRLSRTETIPDISTGTTSRELSYYFDILTILPRRNYINSSSNNYYSLLCLDNCSIFIKNSIMIKGLVIIGGGGGGGGSNTNGDSQAGGGGGGQIYYNDNLNLNLNTGIYQIIVGSGGLGGSIGASGVNGGNSSAFNTVAFGGNGGTNGNGDHGNMHGVGGESKHTIKNGDTFKYLGRGGFARVNYVLTDREERNFYRSPDSRFRQATKGLKINNQKLINMILNSLGYDTNNRPSYIYLANGGCGVNNPNDRKEYGKGVIDITGTNTTYNSGANGSGQNAIVYGSGGGASSADGRSSQGRNNGQRGGNGMHGLVYFWF
jgi:hypothetical protein